MKALPHLKAYVRLVSAYPEMIKIHDSFIINPEVTMYQYAPVKFLAAAPGGEKERSSQVCSQNWQGTGISETEAEAIKRGRLP